MDEIAIREMIQREVRAALLGYMVPDEGPTLKPPKEHDLERLGEQLQALQAVSEQAGEFVGSMMLRQVTAAEDTAASMARIADASEGITDALRQIAHAIDMMNLSLEQGQEVSEE